jgi:type II secretory pathway component PulJ
MRLTRVRFTLRSTMVAVAVLASVCGVAATYYRLRAERAQAAAMARAQRLWATEAYYRRAGHSAAAAHYRALAEKADPTLGPMP